MKTCAHDPKKRFFYAATTVAYDFVPMVVTDHFKKAKARQDGGYSIQAGGSYRLLGYKVKDTMFWFWIGDHDDNKKMDLL